MNIATHLTRALIASAIVATLGASTARADDASPTAAAALRFGRWDADGWYQEGYFRGDQRLSKDAFLIAAGRRDVVDRVKTRRWLRIGLVAGGVLVAAGGVIFHQTRPGCDDVPNRPGPGDEHQACLDERDTSRTFGTLVVVAGGALVIGGVALGHLRPSRRELRAIARAHNARVRAQGTAVILTPTISPRSAGVVVSLTF